MHFAAFLLSGAPRCVLDRGPSVASGSQDFAVAEDPRNLEVGEQYGVFGHANFTCRHCFSQDVHKK